MKLVICIPTSLMALCISDLAFAEAQTAENLQEIIVTAQKRSENLQNVPIAINAASEAQLLARGVTNTMNLPVVSPGLNIRLTAGSFQPSLRGIGTSSTATENPVALYIDGVYIPQQREGVRELEDIEQIAVLKGPQGTLFGRNATAGVIQITTKAPSFNFVGRARAEIDNYAAFKAGLYVAGGLSDSIAASLSTSYTKQGDGWGSDFTNSHDTYKILHDFSIRGKLLAKLGDLTEVLVAADYSDSKKLWNSTQPFPGTQYSFANPYTSAPLKSVFDTYAGTDGFNAMRGGGVSLTINHQTDAVKLVSITAYRDVVSDYQFDSTAVPQQIVVAHSPRSPSKSLSQELQVISMQNNPLKWMFGLYYFHYKNGTDPIERIFGGPLAPATTSVARQLAYATEISESVAPFGELKWEFLRNTHITLGGRYTYEQRKLTGAKLISTSVGGLISTTTLVDKAVDFSQATARVGLDHEFSNAVLAYASFNTGFKSGGFNTVSPATSPYKPEKLKAYEIGFKTKLFDNQLRFNSAAFYYDYTNLQVVQFVGVLQTVVNGPKAKLYGLDIDFAAQIAPGLQLSGGAELMHTEFTDYPNAVFSTPKLGGGAIVFAGDATGNRLPLAQDFAATLAIDYHYQMPAGSLDFNATANYNGDYFFEASNNLLRQGAYTIINASVSWTLPGDEVTMSVWGKNLADEKVIGVTNAVSTLGYPAMYGIAPRTFGASVTYTF
jgi:iron complex outermembrane recepter protein